MPDSPCGILTVDKPAGMTSHDVVGRVRRALRTKRVGHAGTLDPDATGVLVVAVGAATRLLPYLPLEPKVYVARAAFGQATDTEDASGKPTQEADASALSEADLTAVLPRFIGDIAQVPPMVSALHHEGRRLYELAREGVVVERAARTVTIFELDASDFMPGKRAEVTLRVSCGGGTYIRTLCVDIGTALGLPAHMKTLQREAVGRFTLADTVTLEALSSETPLTPMEEALNLPKVTVSDADAARLSRGQAIVSHHDFGEGAAIALLYRERLHSLARLENGVYQPFRVFDATTEKRETADE